MPPAKKTTAASKRSRVMGGAEDEVITDPPPPAEASDPSLSSDAKRELFADEPKSDDTDKVTAVETMPSIEPANDGAQTELSAAHPVDEDPEQHIGDETKDPWADDEQTDWPNNESTEEVSK